MKVCELDPDCKVPVLHAAESALPLGDCAEPVIGDEAGKVEPAIAVAVCAKPSLLTKRTVLPTGTIVTAGA
jgi:hypothetical protein